MIISVTQGRFKFITPYSNLELISLVVIIISICYCYIVLTKVIYESWEHNDVTSIQQSPTGKETHAVT